MRRHHLGTAPRLLVRLPTPGAVLVGASAAAQDSAVPVYVRIALADASLRVGAPIRLRVTLENRLPVALQGAL